MDTEILLTAKLDDEIPGVILEADGSEGHNIIGVFNYWDAVMVKQAMEDLLEKFEELEDE